MSPARREVIAREARDALFRLCCALGLVGGILWAANHPATATCTLHGSSRATEITDCARQSLLDGMTPYLVGGGVGLLVGATLGIIVALMIPRPGRTRKAGGRRSSSQQEALRSAQGTPVTGRWISARYPGKCSACGGPVRPGDRVKHVPGRVTCWACASG